MPALFVRPAGERDRSAVGRPGRRVLVSCERWWNEALRRSARQVHRPDRTHSLYDRALSVGRHMRPSQESGLEWLPIVQGHSLVGHLRDGPLDAYFKGNSDHLARRNVDALQLSALCDEDLAAFAIPRVARKVAGPIAAVLLQISLDRVHQQPLGAGLHVAQPQRGARPELLPLERNGARREAPAKGNLPAIGGGPRRECAAARQSRVAAGTTLGPFRNAEDIARRQIEPAQLRPALGRIIHVRHFDGEEHDSGRRGSGSARSRCCGRPDASAPRRAHRPRHTSRFR